jgi:6-phosphogluconolactonase
MLGVGPDGHVASLFPGLPGITQEGTVIGVVDSPKPPPVRMSFTLSTINAAREVWLVASGSSKADAIARALNQGADSGLPAALVRGTQRTLALLDVDAAAGLASTTLN